MALEKEKKIASPYTPKTLRIPPHNIDSERALLGSIMVRSHVFSDVLDLISSESFYSDKHRIIFEAMHDLFARHEPIDLLSTSARLKERGHLENIGGRTYLTELTSSSPSATNVEYYADIVGRKATLRELLTAGDYISELGFNEGEELEIVLDQAEKKIFSVTSKSNKKQRFIGIKEVLPHSWETMEALHAQGGDIRGVPTGFHDLDNKLSGLMPSDLIILAARPSMGKTSLALDIVRQAALKHNISVGIFSLEMSSQQLVDRMLAAEAQVDSWKMRTGKNLTDDDFLRVRDAMERLSKAPIYIDDQPANSILRMRSIARRLKSEHGLKLIVVDYLQLMTTTKNYDSMVNQVTEISRSLKALARELEVPVVALSQLSRAVESRGGKPRLSDLRDSGAIEQDADVVMFIHREDKYNEDSDKPNIAEILIEKHRNGPTGSCELYFDEAKTSFLNIEKSDFKDYGFDAPANANDASLDEF